MWEVLVSDYLGTPVEAYDEEGKKVWERNLNIYGRVKTEEALGEKNFIPFRFQGQYEDEEIGLYYNHFRYYSSEDGCYTQQDPIGLAGGNPTIYGYVCDPNWWLDPFGLKINFEKFTDEELLEKIWELAYRDKRLYNNGGTHGVVHRIREQILGKMRPPSKGWYTHDEQIRAELDNLRKALNEARSRGMSDVVNNKYPNIDKVSELQPPKSTDAKVPKICQ
jgi:RHS repeat-associated protein